jgi:surface polysaccharide O-acyltransferase-like enzyme
VFLWARNATWPEAFSRPSGQKAIAALSAASFGIYFVHPIVLSLLEQGSLGIRISMTSFDSPLVGIPLTTVATFGLSFLIVQAIRAVPGGKYIAP